MQLRYIAFIFSPRIVPFPRDVRYIYQTGHSRDAYLSFTLFGFSLFYAYRPRPNYTNDEIDSDTDSYPIGRHPSTNSNLVRAPFLYVVSAIGDLFATHRRNRMSVTRAPT